MLSLQAMMFLYDFVLIPVHFLLSNRDYVLLLTFRFVLNFNEYKK